MNVRCFFLGSALLLLLVNGSFAGDGAYQRTKDGKTIVWNNSPEPGDAAAWSGKRDAEGYATGHGTLTWYTTKGVVVTGSNIPSSQHVATGRYTGSMDRGKFEGAVVVVNTTGRTFHGTFAAGRLAGDWSAGPAPSSISNEQEPNERVHSKPVATARAKEPASPAVEPEAPAAGPSEPPVAAHPPPENVAKPPKQISPPPAPAAKETPSAEVDDSLRSLISSPSLERMDRVANPSPKASVAPRSTSASPPPSRPRLTEIEVITLADAEAHARGYNLGEYLRPQAHYATTGDTWSVSYDQKSVDGMPGRRFSVSVEDKTKKTSIVSGR